MARLLKALVLASLAAALLWLAWVAFGRSSGPRTPAGEPVGRGGALVASIRSDATSYNRYVVADSASDVISLLTQARLVRVNRATDELEPWLAERWIESDNGLAYTVKLRSGLKFSDGAPFSSADVLFSFRVVYDPEVKSPLRPALEVGGRPLEVSARDDLTVDIRFPEPFAPGLRVLDNLPILPAHKLLAAFEAGELRDAWRPSAPLSDLAGLGPFVLSEHVAGQRLVFTRNPHYFRRDSAGTQLPYLDRLTLAVVPDQTTEALRLQAGEIDLMVNGDIRPQDYAAFKQLSDENRVRLIEVGTGLDPDFLSFNLRAARRKDPRWSWLGTRAFRQAVSYAVDREALANTVYLGAAVPIHGPVSPGNRTWYADDAPSYSHDPARARELLREAGLGDRDGDGMLEDKRGQPARFSILTQAGHLRERAAAVIQEHLRQVGLTVDVVGLDPRGLFQRWSSGDYDAIYFGLQASSTDPALSPEFWFSGGFFHFWNPGQSEPETEWEGRIDELMRRQASGRDLASRQAAFAEVQRILGTELPSIYFVAPRVILATSPRVLNPTPALQIPQLLWSADTLAAAGTAAPAG